MLVASWCLRRFSARRTRSAACAFIAIWTNHSSDIQECSTILQGKLLSVLACGAPSRYWSAF